MTNQEFAPLNPIAVANFIIDTLSNVAQESPLTNLKLQKMLYYLQAAFLVEHDQPLINDTFMKWQYGPVSQTVYNVFSQYGATPITKPESIISVKDFTVNTPMINRNFEYTQKLTKYIMILSQYSATELVSLTQHQNIWSNNHDHNAAYTNDEIKSYFKTIEPAQIWNDQLIELKVSH